MLVKTSSFVTCPTTVKIGFHILFLMSHLFIHRTTSWVTIFHPCVVLLMYIIILIKQRSVMNFFCLWIWRISLHNGCSIKTKLIVYDTDLSSGSIGWVIAKWKRVRQFPLKSCWNVIEPSNLALFQWIFGGVISFDCVRETRSKWRETGRWSEMLAISKQERQNQHVQIIIERQEHLSDSRQLDHRLCREQPHICLPTPFIFCLVKWN